MTHVAIRLKMGNTLELLPLDTSAIFRIGIDEEDTLTNALGSIQKEALVIGQKSLQLLGFIGGIVEMIGPICQKLFFMVCKQALVDQLTLSLLGQIIKGLGLSQVQFWFLHVQIHGPKQLVNPNSVLTPQGFQIGHQLRVEAIVELGNIELVGSRLVVHNPQTPIR